jgi:pimeloyl-ACP methyl ester carboxylesterase
MYTPLAEPPDAVAGRIAPTPLLVVHGDADHYFPLEHARWLVRAAGPTATLWELPGFGHAESWVTPDLSRRIVRWAADASARMRG